MRRLSQVLNHIVPLSFMIAVCFLAYYGSHAIGQLTLAKAANAPASGTPLTIDELKTRLDDLKWILGFIVGAAGFFAIIQAAISFFNAQTFTKQADEAVKRIEHLASDAEKRFPIFTKMEDARREAYATLYSEFPNEGLDWEDRVYEKMPLPKRQHVLSVERFVGIEFVPHSEDRPQYASNLRRLANFYASKYLYENKHDWVDVERAEYYLTLALKETNDAFYLLNDLGLLHLEFKVTPDLAKAKDYFERSLQKNSGQQRAHYNLGVTAARRGCWAEAETCYLRALAQHVWEQTAIPKMKCDVLYNLGCARARLHYAAKAAGDTDKAGKLLHDCLDALDEAAGIGTIEQRTVDRDLDDKEQGDLFGLKGDPATAVRLEMLRAQLSLPKTNVPRKWKERLDRVVKSLRGEF